MITHGTSRSSQPALSVMLMPSKMPACIATKLQNSTGEGTTGAHYTHTHHYIRKTVVCSVGVPDRGSLHVTKCSRWSDNTRTLNHAFSGSFVLPSLMQTHFYLWSWCAGRWLQLSSLHSFLLLEAPHRAAIGSVAKVLYTPLSNCDFAHKMC